MRPRRRPSLRRPDHGPLIVRVADLVDGDRDAVAAAAQRTGVAHYAVTTGAGTLLTLETTVPRRTPFGRTRAIRDLQATLAVISSGLESRSVPSTTSESEE